MTPKALFHPARLARRPVLSTQSDERLVDLVRAGSDPAFEAIVERYRRPLMRYVARLLAPERAEDVVQQSFVKAYEAMRRDSAELNLRPWLYRIAHNNTLNALRDRGLRHEELDERADGVERPDQALERSLGLAALVAAVQALPERQRDAILLRELEGRSYDEIAAALGVTDGAVRQLLNRARNTLRAAAAAVTPVPLLTRLASGEPAEPVAARVAELVGMGAAGGGAVVAKVCATALVTGAVVGGAAVAPDIGRDEPRATKLGMGTEPAVAADRAAPGGDAASDPAGGGPGDDGAVDGEGDRDDGKGESPDRSGRREGAGEEREDRSGRRGGGGRDDADEDDDHRGRDEGREDGDDDDADDLEDELEEAAEDAAEDAREGSGSGSGSGKSGSGKSGSGKSGSGKSGPGSGGSGSGGSGSGSGSSGEVEEPETVKPAEPDDDPPEPDEPED